MTDHDQNASGPPAGQPQAPGPPTPSQVQTTWLMPTVRLDQSSSVGKPSLTSQSKFGAKMDITGSLIVADRSRNEVDNEKLSPPESGHQHEVEVVLAGPMQDWDPLYMLLIFLGLLICLCAVSAIFLPYSFMVNKPTYSTEKHYSLFDSRACSSFSSAKLEPEDEEKRDVCYKTSQPMGVWVLIMQISACIGLGLGVISLGLQLCNLCLSPRNLRVHMAALYFMAAAGASLSLAGHIGHNRSVWNDKITLIADAYVQVEPIGSGLYLVCSLLAGWSCVVSHVTIHSPGPLSKNTRFLHTLVEEPVVQPASSWFLETVAEKEPKVIIQEEEWIRRESIVSTSV